jgi:hypothetical protein
MSYELQATCYDLRDTIYELPGKRYEIRAVRFEIISVACVGWDSTVKNQDYVWLYNADQHRTSIEFNCAGWLTDTFIGWWWHGTSAVSYYHQQVQTRFLSWQYGVRRSQPFVMPTCKLNSIFLTTQKQVLHLSWWYHLKYKKAMLLYRVVCQCS